MKCSHCYEDNPAWATVCSSCSQPVERLELCPMGHLLPPGRTDCPVCPDLWPEVTAFAGPPVLRGVLWLEQGRLTSEVEPGADLAYLEVRDREQPLALKIQPSGTASIVVDDDDPNILCRVLMRPEGVQVCSRVRPGAPPGPPVYEPLPPGESFRAGHASFRYVAIEPPVWVQKLAGSQQQSG
jgi:hypothetical protein